MDKLKKGIIVLFILLIAGFSLFYPWEKTKPIHYVDRNTGEIKTEKVPGAYWLNWLYYHPFGKLALESMVKKKFLSNWYGKRMDQPISKEKIEAFIQDFNINMANFEEQDYSSFNEFFYRKLKPGARAINPDSLVLISPADGKILAYPQIYNHDFLVKGHQFDLTSYLQNDSLSQIFSDASLFIIRLCPTDYHRYHFPAAGEVILEQKINGDYYSVSPLALRQKVELLTMNKRKYSIVRSKEFGDIIYSEVAATLVGSMIDTYKDAMVSKGEEKGYFKFGGSTIILIMHKDSIHIDEDLIKNTKRYLETEIKMGERIGAAN